MRHRGGPRPVMSLRGGCIICLSAFDFWFLHDICMILAGILYEFCMIFTWSLQEFRMRFTSYLYEVCKRLRAVGLSKCVPYNWKFGGVAIRTDQFLFHRRAKKPLWGIEFRAASLFLLLLLLLLLFVKNEFSLGNPRLKIYGVFWVV